MLLASAAPPARAQEAGGAPQTLVVLPFDNVSQAPGLEWIGESFPEILGQRLALDSLHVVGREERMYAFDRLEIGRASCRERV